MKVEEGEQPKSELPGFNMEQVETEFAFAQLKKMTEQQAILKSI